VRRYSGGNNYLRLADAKTWGERRQS
jgi:hypothetical protein